MESLGSRELILDLVLELLSEPKFVDRPSPGIVLQAYLRDAEETGDRVLYRRARAAASRRSRFAS